MTNVCEYGFKCPYSCYSEDADLICTYPKLAKDVGEDEAFYACNETICELLDYKSELQYILRAYEKKVWGEVNDAILALKKEDEEWLAEWKKHCEECDRRIEE